MPFLAIGDGVGGLPNGDVASKVAVTAAVRGALLHPTDAYARTMEAFYAATVSMHAYAGTKYNEMGTTLVTLTFDPRYRVAVIGNAGDSRCYLLRDGEIRRLTKDQNIGGFLYGALMPTKSPDPELKVIEPQAGDCFMLCSDGVSNELTDDQIRSVLLKNSGARGLVRAAVDTPGRGRDNATVIIVRLRDY